MTRIGAGSVIVVFCSLPASAQAPNDYALTQAQLDEMVRKKIDSIRRWRATTPR